MTADRKRQARETFLLGGIVAKAGLTTADRAFLLGGFIELARIAPGSPEHRRLRDLGAEAFRATSMDAASPQIGETAEWH
ncbi:conjugal transfer protein TraD [Phyllobacterium zundukense]|uniref:Conjugal transfer protein TraD n=1 Tax=Phyllobacterium zundukense TaxID=1867719 RepID=A0ACD4CVW3_9HYPH|nr:conjugal transfer protein TraD [Phyllobacterium zundukense]UXN57735.1 conjugal transfer protein TraD [Phyllobacterium zundukense]